MFHVTRNSPAGSPVDPGALDAHGDSQVDRGPARLFLSAVATLLVPWTPQGHAQHRWPLRGWARRDVATRGERGRIFGLNRWTQKQVRTLEYETCVYCCLAVLFPSWFLLILLCVRSLQGHSYSLCLTNPNTDDSVSQARVTDSGSLSTQDKQLMVASDLSDQSVSAPGGWVHFLWALIGKEVVLSWSGSLLWSRSGFPHQLPCCTSSFLLVCLGRLALMKDGPSVTLSFISFRFFRQQTEDFLLERLNRYPWMMSPLSGHELTIGSPEAS
ncbi:hypothetical protein GOODEAATRI_018445 [Goodea atripinnis]|uniref:Uncharacterized protein n=1 Tax=Goodea atripinnis TaxID=208336 RepID=A0ABV0MIV7_9TELE